MYQSSEKQRGRSPVAPRGESPFPSSAQALPARGRRCCSRKPATTVTLHERSDAAMTQSTSYWAGGMLAPWCEAETSEPVISRLGIRSLDLWREHFPQTRRSTARWWWRIRATAPTSNVLPG